jgi:uncharacterized YccA/Bax inhibitor family protein
MEIAARLAIGAAVGALGGWVIGRARACGSQACNVKASRVYSIVAGAFFGAAVAWYLMRSGS